MNNTAANESQNPTLKLKTTLLNVADFRFEIDHLFDVVNRDYHACVGLKEYRYFHETLKRVFDRVALVTCKRAKVEDKQRFEKAIQAGINCFHSSNERIQKLEDLQAGIRSRVA